ncbi:unnamed protein product, partial [marine sediment metagenome]
ALDRQYPGEMPQGVEVVDERFIDTTYKVVEEKPGEEGVSPLKDDEKSGEAPGEEESGGSSETVSSSTKKPPKSKKIGVSAAHDPSTIKNFGDLFQALWDDFHLSKSESLKELNVNSQEEIIELPSECYLRIAAVRPLSKKE